MASHRRSCTPALVMVSSIPLLLLLLLPTFIPIPVATAKSKHHVAKGLSWNFHRRTCPDLEFIIRSKLEKVFESDIGMAAALLRIHFHDCFVLGCDGSVLLDSTANAISEKESPPNLTLRRKAFDVIENLRELVEKECGQVVSCADIATIAARDAVYLSGGPDYEVPLGRRDSLTSASNETVLANIPAPTTLTGGLITSLASKNLDTINLVALSGAHTIGVGHCPSFAARLYPDDTVNVMDPSFAKQLKITCPTVDTDNTAHNDIKTPNKFDNKYFVNLRHRKGLFTSDQTLYTDSRTKEYVESFAEDQELFFEEFVTAMIKMGQLDVLTGGRGEVRARCNVANSGPSYAAEVAEDVSETIAEL